jgi:hypothetical protein
VKTLLTLTVSIISLSLSAQAVAQNIVRGPYLQNGTASQVTVRWRTDVAVPTKIKWGSLSSPLAQGINKDEITREHTVTLAGLEPNRRYTYSVVLPSGTTDPVSFTTAPASESESFKVWVLGDAGSSGTLENGEDDAQIAVRDSFLKQHPIGSLRFMMFLGDNAYKTGTDLEYQRAVFSIYRNALHSLVAWSTQGNHDETANAYYNVFTFPQHGEAGGVPSGTEGYYSFDYSNAHFISLNSFIAEKPFRSDMIEWLKRDLAANKKTWTVAMFHHPAYSAGTHNSDLTTKHEAPMRWMRENIVPILEQGGVDVVMSGHSHGYERSKLINGHYGDSSTFTDAFVKDGGSGDPREGHAYKKPGRAPIPHAGTVYVVAGNGGIATKEPGSHPVMFTSTGRYGSVLLEFSQKQLTSSMVGITGEVEDRFAIIK